MDLHDYAVDATGGSYLYPHAGREVKTGGIQGPREYDMWLTITDETIALASPLVVVVGGGGGGGESKQASSELVFVCLHRSMCTQCLINTSSLTQSGY